MNDEIRDNFGAAECIVLPLHKVVSERGQMDSRTRKSKPRARLRSAFAREDDDDDLPQCPSPWKKSHAEGCAHENRDVPDDRGLARAGVAVVYQPIVGATPGCEI